MRVWRSLLHSPSSGGCGFSWSCAGGSLSLGTLPSTSSVRMGRRTCTTVTSSGAFPTGCQPTGNSDSLTDKNGLQQQYQYFSDTAPIPCVVTMATVECKDELLLFLISLSEVQSFASRSSCGCCEASTSSSQQQLRRQEEVQNKLVPQTRVVVGCSSSLLKSSLLADLQRFYEEEGAALAGGHGQEGDEEERLGFGLEVPVDEAGHCVITLPSLRVEFLPLLDPYSTPLKRIDRQEMERTKGIIYVNRHTDFMMEKATLMEYALATATSTSPGGKCTSANDNNGVLFLDCDIVSLYPLPRLCFGQKTKRTNTTGTVDDEEEGEHHSAKKEESVDEKRTPALSCCGGLLPHRSRAVGVSPHHIQKQDTLLFGQFNGGWFYTNDPMAIFIWRKATHVSRYYDQASLEDVYDAYAGAGEGHEEMMMQKGGRSTGSQDANKQSAFWFPYQCNFGYWRLFQAELSVEEMVTRRFSLGPYARSATSNGDGPTEQQEHSSAITPSSITMAAQERRGETTASVTAELLPPAAMADGLCWIQVDSRPLQSIHTHMLMPCGSSKTMALFNPLMLRWMERCLNYTGHYAAHTGAEGPGGNEPAASTRGHHPYASILRAYDMFKP